MNLVGKILTLLIFVMSITFMAWAVMVYQARNNWRDDVLREKAAAGKPKGWKYQLQDAEAKKAELEKQKTRMKKQFDTELAAHERTIADLRDKAELWEKQCKEQKQTNDVLRETISEKIVALQGDQTTLSNMQKERDTYKADINDAREARDKSFELSRKLAEKVHELTIEKKRLLARYEDLVQDFERVRDIARSNNLNPDANPLTIQPNVKGIVVAMPEKGHMEVSLGADDGLLPGHYLEVYRVGSGASIYLGRIEVVRTEPDRAVCRILPEYRKGRMKTGDRVASKLE